MAMSAKVSIFQQDQINYHHRPPQRSYLAQTLIKTPKNTKMPNGDRAPWRPLFENFKIQNFQFQKILKINTDISRYRLYMCANFQVEIH